jgi:hypothetical protein
MRVPFASVACSSHKLGLSSAVGLGGLWAESWQIDQRDRCSDRRMEATGAAAASSKQQLLDRKRVLEANDGCDTRSTLRRAIQASEATSDVTISRADAGLLGTWV